MDQIFEFLPKNADHINYLVNKDAIRGRKFSDVYHKLLPNPQLELTAAMQSFLQTLDTFEFSERIYGVQKEKQIVDQIYSNHEIPTWARRDAYDFLVYLVWMYSKVVRTYGRYHSRTRFENIFGFMDGFEIQKTKVVIIGQDPSPICQSNGYAFHGSKCQSTRNLIDFLNMEFRIVDKFTEYSEKLELCETDSYTASCKLDGWINQNVLMFNTYLTLSHPRESGSESGWLKFTMFFVKKLCQIQANLVFILTGHKAQQMARLIQEVNLKEKKKHKVFCLLHPRHKNALWDRKRPLDLSKWETKHWNVDLPFINANFYLFQVYENYDYIIKWHTMSSVYRESQTKIQSRMNAWRELFKNLLLLTKKVQHGSSVCTETFIISGIRKVLQLKRNPLTGFHEVRCIDAVVQKTTHYFQ